MRSAPAQLITTLSKKAKGLGFLSSGTLPDLLTGQFGEGISAKQGFEVTLLTGPRSPTSTWLNPEHTQSCWKERRGCPTALCCPVTTLQLHLSHHLTPGTEKVPVQGSEKLHCFQRDTENTFQHTTFLRTGRLADYNTHIQLQSCTTEGLPPEGQDSSGSLTLPSTSSPSSTDEGHHHDPRDSIKAYWDPVASIKTRPA